MPGYLFVHKILLVPSHFFGTTDFKLQCVPNFQVTTEKLQTSNFNTEHLERFCASKDEVSKLQYTLLLNTYIYIYKEINN